MSAGWADAVASAPNVVSARIATKATVLLHRPAIMTNDVVLSLGTGDLSTSAWNDFSAKMLELKGMTSAEVVTGEAEPERANTSIA